MSMQILSPDELLGRPLNEIEKRNAPERLYVKGQMDIPLGPRKVAVVGTRKPTKEGINETRAVTELLVSKGVVVVSGLAMGIDTVAHRAAIYAKGRTVAVLGTPLDKRYPSSNGNLQDQIAANHLVASQFPPGYPVTKRNFVMRNRTMALLSDATVIVEAGDTSGTIHQGWETLRLGRPLFVCRAAATIRPKWLDEMEQYGAVILQEHTDILYEIPLGKRWIDVFVQQAS